MTKATFIERMVEKTGMTKKDATTVVDAFLETVTEGLVETGEVTFTGFGKFSVVERSERSGFNPQTKEPITIPAKKVAKFKAGKLLAEKVAE